jgi:hypothetical protein
VIIRTLGSGPSDPKQPNPALLRTNADRRLAGFRQHRFNIDDREVNELSAECIFSDSQKIHPKMRGLRIFQ